MKKDINLGTEANKVDKVIISYLSKIGLDDENFDTNFTISGKDRPDVAIKDKVGKYSILFENKKDFKDLIGAKTQGIKYLIQLNNLNVLSEKILLIRTNMSTFHADEYEIQDGKIVWIKEITSIDILEDIKIELIKKYTHPEKKQEEKLLSTDKQKLKKAFDGINNFLRDKGLGKDQRLHITMAILFLKLIKENDDLLESIENGSSKNDLLDELDIIKNTVTEKSIINVFEAVNKVYNKEFHFDMEQYKNKNILKGLFDIIDELNLSNYDLDIKGEAFEYFINYGNTSSDTGEYFTPRHLVRFMVDLLDEAFLYNREQLFGKTYFDPTCGTGGFLIEVFKEIKNELIKSKKNTPENIKFLKENSVHGNELNLRSSEIAKMNMILTGDGHSNINQGDFIELKEERKGKYDVSIGNPPFGKNREWEFVDGFLKDVKIGGYSIIIVPEGVLFKADKNFIEIRKKLVNKGKLLKVISLPAGVFQPYTGVKTNIIFWLNEAQTSNYNIEFIDIKNDGFSLDTNRKELNNSDLVDYFEDKQKLIDNEQIFTVNSSQIYDKTKLNELELEKSNLELEQKEVKKKVDIMKKQLKEIDNKEEKKLKENKTKEFQEKFENIKKQNKKISDKLKGFDLNLVVNRYKVQKEVNKNINYESFIDLVEYLPKSKRKASEGNEIGKYPFFTSSEIQNKWTDNFDYKEESLIIGTGGSACIHYGKEFSTSTDNFIVQTIPGKVKSKYLYFVLKYNLNILEAGFNGAGLKHISKDYINNIQIPLPSLEYQEEIVKEIEEYESFIKGAKHFIENYKTKIDVKEEWKTIELGDIGKVSMCKRIFKDETNGKSGIPFYKIGTFGKKADSFIDEELFNKYKNKFSFPKKGDILISTSGTIGKTVIFDGKPAYFQDSNIVWVNNDEKIILNKYLYIIFQEINWVTTKGGTIERLYNKLIQKKEILVPTFSEQQRIIDEFDEIQKLVDSNKKLIEIFEKKINKKIIKLWEGE